MRFSIKSGGKRRVRALLSLCNGDTLDRVHHFTNQFYHYPNDLNQFCYASLNTLLASIGTPAAIAAHDAPVLNGNKPRPCVPSGTSKFDRLSLLIMTSKFSH